MVSGCIFVFFAFCFLGFVLAMARRCGLAGAGLDNVNGVQVNGVAAGAASVVPAVRADLPDGSAWRAGPPRPSASAHPPPPRVHTTPQEHMWNGGQGPTPDAAAPNMTPTAARAAGAVVSPPQPGSQLPPPQPPELAKLAAGRSAAEHLQRSDLLPRFFVSCITWDAVPGILVTRSGAAAVFVSTLDSRTAWRKLRSGSVVTDRGARCKAHERSGQPAPSLIGP